MSVFEELRAHAALDFEDARMLPATAYRDPEVLRAEIRELFTRDWLCVGRADQVADAGDHLTTDLPGPHGTRSVLVVRGDDGVVRAFDNVCVHRAAQLVTSERGSTARFVCPYHAWTYRLDGSLIGAPHAEGRIDPACHGLNQLRVETWEGFLFVSQDPAAAPLAPGLVGLTDVVDRYDMASYRTVHSTAEVWGTNWKLLVENFVDAYHVFHVHRATFGADGDSVDETVLYPGTDAWTHHRVVEQSRPDLAAPTSALEGAWRKTIVLAAVFPAFVMQLQPDWCWSLQLTPVGTDRVRIVSQVAVAPATLDHLGSEADTWTGDLLAFVDRVNAEDRPVIESVRRAIDAPQFDRAPLTPMERNVFDFDRYISGRIS